MYYMQIKYEVKNTNRGWEIFEDGTNWEVRYNTMDEAVETLFKVVKITNEQENIFQSI